MTPLTWTPDLPLTLDLGDERLECLCLGPSPNDAPTLVLLHEGLGCVALWRDVPRKLAEASGCGVFVYSRRGYGRSSPVALPRPLDYMTREATETLPRVLAAIGFQSGVLIGHSDGASIAAIYVGAQDDRRVKGLVLIAPHFFAETEGLAAIAGARRAYEEGDLKPKLAKYHDDADGAFYGWNRAWLDPGFRDWNIAGCIENWRTPALVLQGDEDPYGTLRQVEAAATRARVEVETRILRGVKHAPQFERPETTALTIAAFVRRTALRHAERAQKFGGAYA